jgi:hypothetical protein
MRPCSMATESLGSCGFTGSTSCEALGLTSSRPKGQGFLSVTTQVPASTRTAMPLAATPDLHSLHRLTPRVPRPEHRAPHSRHVHSRRKRWARFMSTG